MLKANALPKKYIHILSKEFKQVLQRRDGGAVVAMEQQKKTK